MNESSKCIPAYVYLLSSDGEKFKSHFYFNMMLNVIKNSFLNFIIP